MEAHGSTLEVLKVAGEVGVSEERFHKAGERKFQCMFCTKRFEMHHVQKHHILMYHWKDWDSKVSWGYLCWSFHNNYYRNEVSLWILIVYYNQQRQKRAHDWDKAIKKVRSDHESVVKELSKQDNEKGISSKVNEYIWLWKSFNIFMYRIGHHMLNI